MLWENDYISISQLTIQLQLPRNYVDKLVKQGVIPTILVNGRRRATEIAARAALDELAANQSKPTALRRHRTILAGSYE